MNEEGLLNMTDIIINNLKYNGAYAQTGIILLSKVKL